MYFLSGSSTVYALTLLLAILEARNQLSPAHASTFSLVMVLKPSPLSTLNWTLTVVDLTLG